MFGAKFSGVAMAAALIAAPAELCLPSTSASPTRLYRAAYFRGCRE
jgi:hypothetical protein